ncbi:hypothetical protein AVEN_28596-1 [Araneus ventricosus]|uniref:Uncharacterized protein n=1 Tax=Araneus ventricosus TaxID=182803 RepID=A0A4Y2DFQ1_ARAVE|nr:hypothetical protein AVEN_28596-1 [Araneus ventricosus]
MELVLPPYLSHQSTCLPSCQAPRLTRRLWSHSGSHRSLPRNKFSKEISEGEVWRSETQIVEEFAWSGVVVSGLPKWMGWEME